MRWTRDAVAANGPAEVLIRAVAAAAALAGILTANAVRAAEPAHEVVQIPLADARPHDAAALMVTGVFRPDAAGQWPVIIYSHGRAGSDVERRRPKLLDPRGHVRYWLGKGFAVVAPVRPGYGETGGADQESSGIRYDMFGNCWGPPDFGHAASAARAAIIATLKWIRDQPWADATRVVLVGSSMGGLTSIATAASNPDGVVGYINFAGGTGGDGGRAPRRSCGSEEMAALMHAYGSTTHVRGMWLYAENDLYWGAEWPRAWHRAFAASGSDAEFIMTEPLPNADGHQLLARGSRLWTMHVDRFLRELGF
jgi:dienelactone hydrolase